MQEVSDSPRSHGCALFLPPSPSGPPPLPLAQDSLPAGKPADCHRSKHLLGARQPHVRCLRRPLPDGIAIPCFFLRACWCVCSWGMGGVRCACVHVNVLQGESSSIGFICGFVERGRKESWRKGRQKEEEMRWRRRSGGGGGDEVEEVDEVKGKTTGSKG